MILLTSCLILSWFYFHERDKFDRYRIKSVLNSNQLKAVNEGLKGAFLDSQVFNNKQVCLPGNENLLDHTLCLYISENHCSVCVNASLAYYLSNHNNIPDSTFIIYANFNSNSIKHLKVEHQLKCKITSIYGTNISIAKNKYPCFFVYNKASLETEMFLFPLKRQPEMMKKYFENVSRRYFSDEME
jgi:hypothetical protein